MKRDDVRINQSTVETEIDGSIDRARVNAKDRLQVITHERQRGEAALCISCQPDKSLARVRERKLGSACNATTLAVSA